VRVETLGRIKPARVWLSKWKYFILFAIQTQLSCEKGGTEEEEEEEELEDEEEEDEDDQV